MPARVFLAIDMPEGVRKRLSALQSLLRESDPRWLDEKWVRPDLFHVTVRFIGRLEEADARRLLLALQRPLARLNPFRLELQGVRAVPNPRHAAMVWATLAADRESLSAVASDVEEALSSIVARDEPRSNGSHAHVTLVRARRPHALARAAVDGAEGMLADAGKDTDRIVSVRSLTLYSSTLGRGGPTCERMGEVTLGPARPQGAD
jgi:2'-5' RNA ligase